MKGRRRQRRHNDCRGKAQYGTFEEALREQPAQRPYLCGKCGCVHLTTHPIVF